MKKKTLSLIFSLILALVSITSVTGCAAGSDANAQTVTGSNNADAKTIRVGVSCTAGSKNGFLDENGS
jgi:hypothetical protein